MQVGGPTGLDAGRWEVPTPLGFTARQRVPTGARWRENGASLQVRGSSWEVHTGSVVGVIKMEDGPDSLHLLSCSRGVSGAGAGGASSPLFLVSFLLLFALPPSGPPLLYANGGYDRLAPRQTLTPGEVLLGGDKPRGVRGERRRAGARGRRQVGPAGRQGSSGGDSEGTGPAPMPGPKLELGV